MKYAPVVGRVLYSLIFLRFGMAHFTAPQMMIDNGLVPAFLPAKMAVVLLTGVVVVLGGVSILLGWKIKLGSLILFFFLLGTTFLTWSSGFFAGDEVATGMFMRDLALAGGALLIHHHGAGGFSLDGRRSSASE